jgi:hypothetical protein
MTQFNVAVIILNGVSNIVTNDIDDWVLFKDKYNGLREGDCSVWI